jgi:acetylornithine deacetylase/succinyl-diaminopimelate desuccinylase-like protein
MAVACAAAELLRKRALGVDLVFLIEGEEETGSAGFMDAIRKHKVRPRLLQLTISSSLYLASNWRH